MISNQILQNTIDGVKAISNVDFSVADVAGKLIVSTGTAYVDYETEVKKFIQAPVEFQTKKGCLYFKIYDEYHMEYILLVHGDGDAAETVGKMTAFQIQGLLAAYQERFDKDNFVKSLLLDNLLLIDIYNRAKKLHIDVDAKRVVYIAEVSAGQDKNPLETVRTMVGDKGQDFVTAVDEKNVIIVKELSAIGGYQGVDAYAREILTKLKKEGITKVRISYGTIVKDIKEVSKSYKEAKLASEVGKIFFTEKDVVAYNTLGIGRLIYQLPIPLCKMFIREIFEGKSPDDFDEETLTTINKFFENSLNVSETSRQLYIHRNTLVYRLDKLQKTTGLDLRVFEDAITFKIALMVVKYMKHVETLEY